MPTVSWKKATAAAPADATPPPSSSGTEETTQPSTAVAVATPPGNLAVAPVPPREVDDEGEWDMSQNKDPYLSLFSAKSANAEDFTEWIGTWVVAKQVSLGKEITVIPVKLRNWFEEKTEFESGDIPDRWNTSAEAAASGKEYIHVGEVQMLIEVPKEKETDEIISGLMVDYAGKQYIPVKYTCRKTSFNTVYAQIRTDKGRWLKGRYANGQYRLGITKKTQPVAYLAPTIRMAGATPQEVSDAIREKHQL